MDISFILKIAGVGMIIAAICQVLSKTGRDEQANFVSIAGIIVVLILLVEQIGILFDTIKDVFGL